MASEKGLLVGNYLWVFLILFFLFGFAQAAGKETEYLQEARTYLEKGEVKAAVIQLKNLLKESPLNAEARLLLGKAYLKLGDGPSAVKELEKARDLRSGKEQWLVPLGQAYLLQAKLQKVLDEISLDDQLPEGIQADIYALHGMARLALQDREKALEDFNAALDLDSTHSDALLGLARAELQNKDFKRAIDHANQVLKNDPKNVGAWVLLGEVKRLKNNPQEAIDAFAEAIKLQPHNVQARLGRAIANLALQKPKEAQRDIEHVRKTAGNIPLALYLHGLIAFQNKEFQEAEDALIKVLNAVPGHPPSRLLLGAIAYHQGKLESAENYLSSYLRNLPKHLPATKLLAATRLKLRRPVEAISLLEKFVEEAQQDPQFLALLGSAYLQDKQFDKGVDYLGRAAELAPDAAAIQAQLALGHMASGQLEQAVGELENAVDLGQDLIQADVMLVLALIRQKEHDKAIAAANRLSKKLPDNPMPDNLIGAAYLAQGDADKARKHWQNALDKKPDYASAALNLAKLDFREDKLAAATSAYQKILEFQPDNLAAFIGLAQIAEKRKSYDEMVKWLQKAREKHPAALPPALMLTRYFLAMGKSLQALEIARSAQSHHTDDPMALRNLGLAQMAADKAASAVVTFKQLAARLENSPEARHLLAQALYKNGDRTAASAEWDKALAIAPDFLPAAVARTEVALREKRYPKALEYAQGIQEKNPESAIGYQLEGEIERVQKQYGKAYQAYQKAYRIAASSILAQRLFETLRAMDDDAEAFRLLENWLKGHKHDANAWLALALGYQETGQKRKAMDAYERANELVPNHYLILNNLAWLYHETGDRRAVDLAEKTLNLAENNPEVIDTVGWIFLHHDREDEGLLLLQQAAVLAPHIPLIRLHLAEALIKTGRKDEARKELMRLLHDEGMFPERAQAEALLKAI